MEVGEREECIHIATVTTRMTSASIWAAMRAILIYCFINCEGPSHKTVSPNHNFRRKRRAEADSNRGPSAYQPNALPLGQTGSHCQALLLLKCCSTSTETVGLLGTEAQDGHLDFDAVPELCCHAQRACGYLYAALPSQL